MSLFFFWGTLFQGDIDLFFFKTGWGNLLALTAATTVA